MLVERQAADEPAPRRARGLARRPLQHDLRLPLDRRHALEPTREPLPILVRTDEGTDLVSVIRDVSTNVARARYLALPRAWISQDRVGDAKPGEIAAWRDTAFVYRSEARKSIAADVSTLQNTRLRIDFEQVGDLLNWSWYYDGIFYREKTISQIDSCLRSLLLWGAEDAILTKGSVKSRLLDTAKVSLVKMKGRFTAKSNG